VPVSAAAPSGMAQISPIAARDLLPDGLVFMPRATAETLSTTFIAC